MLLRRDTFAACRALAEAQETTETVAKCGYRLKLGFT